MRNATWKQRGSVNAIDISVGPDGSVWVVDNLNQVRKLNGEKWDVQYAGAMSKRATRICHGASNAPYLATLENTVEHLADTGWVILAPSQGVLDLAVSGKEDLWIVSRKQDPLGGGTVVLAYRGKDWKEVYASGSRIAALQAAWPWHVNALGNVYQYRPGGDFHAGDLNLAWDQRGNGYGGADIGIGADGSVWLAGKSGLSLWNGANWKSLNPLCAVEASHDGGCLAISVFPDGRPVVVRSDGSVWELTWDHQDNVVVTPGEVKGTFAIAYGGKPVGTFKPEIGKSTTCVDDTDDTIHWVRSITLEGVKDKIDASAAIIENADHFNFYQVIVTDENAEGKPNVTPASFDQGCVEPYIDPPRGGFLPSSAGAGDGVWSDNYPWYLDEVLPPGVDDPAATPSGNHMPTEACINFNDDPHMTGGGTTAFVTYIVAVDTNRRPVAFVGGVKWACHGNAFGGRTSEDGGRTPFDYPTVHEYEYMIGQDKPAKVPDWFDSNASHLAKVFPGPCAFQPPSWTDLKFDSLQVLADHIVQNYQLKSVSLGVRTKAHSFQAASGTLNVHNDPAKPGSIYLLASVSKLFVAVALMQLLPKHGLTLDDDILSVPGLTDNIYVRNRLHNQKITFRQLLTHTSSLSDNYYNFRNSDKIDDWFDVDSRPFNFEDYRMLGEPGAKSLGPDFDPKAFREFVEFVFPCQSNKGSGAGEIKNYQNGAPGHVYDYSNLGTALLGYIVSTLSGSSFQGYVREKIFKKCGMDSSYWRLSDSQGWSEADLPQLAWPFGAYNQALPLYTIRDYPNGGLRSTSGDLLKFGWELISGGANLGLAPNAIGPNLDGSRNGLLDRQFTESKQRPGTYQIQNGTRLEDGVAIDGKKGDILDQALLFDYLGDRAGHAGDERGVFTALYMNPAAGEVAVFLCNQEISSYALWANCSDYYKGSSADWDNLTDGDRYYMFLSWVLDKVSAVKSE